MLSPSGKTIRLGALCARWTIRRMIVCCTPPMPPLQPLAVFGDVHGQPRATPDSIAACATAGAHPPQHARVERLRDDVVGAEPKRLHAVGLGHRVGHRLLRELRQRPRRRELHLLVDHLGAHVERAAEDVREAEHVVDLVREVAAPGGDDGVGARGLRVLVGDLGIGVGEREDDRASAPSSSSIVARAEPRLRQAEEHVGAAQGVGERAARRRPCARTAPCRRSSPGRARRR